MDIIKLFFAIGMICFLWNVSVLWLMSGMNYFYPRLYKYGSPVLVIGGWIAIVYVLVIDFMLKS